MSDVILFIIGNFVFVLCMAFVYLTWREMRKF